MDVTRCKQKGAPIPLWRHPGSCLSAAVRGLASCRRTAWCKSAWTPQVPLLSMGRAAFSLRPVRHLWLRLLPCRCPWCHLSRHLHRQLRRRCPQHRRSSSQGRLLCRHSRARRFRRRHRWLPFLRCRHVPLPLLERQTRLFHSYQLHIHLSQPPCSRCHHRRRLPLRPLRPSCLRVHHQHLLRRVIHPACLRESRRHHHLLPPFLRHHRHLHRRPHPTCRHHHRLREHLLPRIHHHLRAAKLPPLPVLARRNLATTTLRAPTPHIPTTRVASGATRAERASSADSAALVHSLRAQPQARSLPPKILLRQLCSHFR